MEKFLCLLVAPIVVLGHQNAPAAQRSAELIKAKPYETTFKPFVKSYCIKCHAGPRAAARVDLSKLDSEKALDAQARLLSRITREVQHKDMPPYGQALPKDTERKAFVEYLAKHTKKK